MKMENVTKKRYLMDIISTDINFERLKIIKKLLPEKGKLLEIGAWDGTTIKYYKQKFKGETYGIDISKKIIKKAEKHFDNLKKCDLNKEKIPYKNNYFDIVICSEVIEHIYDTDRLLEEIKRVLKNTGFLIISTPNLSSFINRIFILFGLQPLGTEVSCLKSGYGNPLRKQNLIPSGHIRNFTYRAFKDIVITHKFKIIKKKATIFSTYKIISIIEKIIGNLFISLGSDVIFKCKKV